MEKIKKSKKKLIVGIIGILLVFGIGFFIGTSYSTIFHINYFRGNQALDLREQIIIAGLLRDEQIILSTQRMDDQILTGLYSLTANGELPEDVTKWNESVFRCFQKAKEYYERYPEILEKDSRAATAIKALLEKVTFSSGKSFEDFAKRYYGETAPALDVSQWIGEPITLEQLKGKVVLLDFWGNWCIGCIVNLPHTEEIHDRYKDKGLEVIGIHSLEQSEKAADFITENNYTFRTGLDTGKTAENYSIKAWPTYYLIDKQGKLAWGPENTFPPIELIKSLLAE